MDPDGGRVAVTVRGGKRSTSLFTVPDGTETRVAGGCQLAFVPDGRWLVLVEGGGVTVSRFLQAGALDRLHVMVAPMLIGSGRPGLVLPPIDTLEEAIRPASRCFACGVDTLFDLELRAADLHGRARGGGGGAGM